MTTMTRAEVMREYGVSDRRLTQLIADGRVGHLETRPHRFLPEHIAQLIDAIEVKPRLAEPVAIPGASRRSAASRRAG